MLAQYGNLVSIRGTSRGLGRAVHLIECTTIERPFVPTRVPGAGRALDPYQRLVQLPPRAVAAPDIRLLYGADTVPSTRVWVQTCTLSPPQSFPKVKAPLDDSRDRHHDAYVTLVSVNIIVTAFHYD